MNDNQVRNLRWRYAGIFATALIVIAVVYLDEYRDVVSLLTTYREYRF